MQIYINGWGGTDENGQDLYYPHYEPQLSNPLITVNYTDGSSVTYTQGELEEKFGYAYYCEFVSEQNYENQWGIGKHDVTLNFMGKTCTFKVEVEENPIRALTVTTEDKIVISNAQEGWHWDESQGMDVPYTYYDLNGLNYTICVDYTDGSSKTFYSRYELEGEFDEVSNVDADWIGDPWEVGMNTAVFSFMGKNSEFDVELVDGPIKNLTVMTTDKVMEMNAQESWYWDESQNADVPYTYYDLNGLNYTIYVDYTDGSSKTFNSRYELENEFGEPADVDADWINDPWEVGELNTAWFIFMGNTYEFDVELVQNPIKSLSVSVTGNFKEGKTTETGHPGENMDYITYEHYDINELNPMITVEYSDGSPMETLSPGDLENKFNNMYSVTFETGQDDKNSWGPGTHTVTATFMGVSCQFDVVVEENPIKSISARTEDTFIEGSQNQYGVYSLDDLNLEIEVEYTTGEKKTFSGRQEFENEFLETYELTTNQDEEPWKVGENEVTLNYLGKTCTFTVEVVETPIKSLKVTTTDKITYQDRYQTTAWNDEKGEYETYYSYYLGGLELNVEVEYKDGTKESLKGHELVAKHNALGKISSDQSASNVWGEGMHKATWTFLNVSAEFDVEVTGNDVESIEFSSGNTLYKGVNANTSRLDLTNPEIIVRYKDGRVLKATYQSASFNFGSRPVLNLENEVEGDLDIGTYTVDVEFLGHTTQYEFKVEELKAVEIYLGNFIKDVSGTQHDNWFEYNVSQVSQTIRVYYQDGTYEDFAESWEINNKFGQFYSVYIHQSESEPLSEAGEYKQTIDYLGTQATVYFEIVENSIKDIRAVYHGDVYYSYSTYPRGEQLEYIITYQDGTVERLFASEKLLGSYIYNMQKVTDVDRPAGGRWDIGTHYWDIELLGFEMRVPVEVIDNPIQKISAKPTRDVVPEWYKTGDEVYVTNINPRWSMPEITVTYTDGTEETYSYTTLSQAFGGEEQFWDFEPGSLEGIPGTGMAQLEFNRRFCWLSFNVIENPVESISAKTTTPLRQGSNYNLSKDAGLTITVKYKDGTTFTGTYEEVYGEFFLYPEIVMPETYKTGKNTATINYLGMTCKVDFEIEEDDNPIVDIEVSAKDICHDRHKHHGKKYCYDHLIEIKLHFKNGTVRKGTLEEFKKEFGSAWIYCEDNQEVKAWKPGKHKIHVFCGGFKESVDIQMIENPYKKVTIRGEDELEIVLEKTDGTKEVHIAKDFEYYHKINDNCTGGYLTTDQGKLYVEFKNVGGSRPDYSDIIYMSVDGVRSNSLENCHWLEQKMLTKVYGDLPKVSVETSSDEFKEITLDDSDHMDSDRMQDTRVWLEVSDVKGQISKEEEKLLEDYMANTLNGYDSEHGLLLDLTLYKQYGEGQAVKVKETNGKDKYICITIRVPDEIIDMFDDPNDETFKIVHIHEGKTKTLDCKYDKENRSVLFYVNEFSTFSLVYESETEEDSSEPSTDGSEPTPDGSEPSIDDSEPSTDGSEPSTDDSEPSTDGSEPSTDGSEPSTDGSEPSTDGSEPSTDGSEPSTDDKEIQTDSNKPTDNGDTGSSSVNKGDSVSTGDQMNVGLWMMAAAVSVSLLMVSAGMMIAGRKKR